MTTNRRKHGRFPWGIPATIEWNLEGHLECTISNTSLSGACLYISADVTLPNEFCVHLAPGGALSRQCRVVWRSGDEVGVSFDANLPGDTPHMFAARPIGFVAGVIKRIRDGAHHLIT